MTSLQIRNESDRARVLGHIAGMDITKPKKLAITEVDRSGEQNKLLHKLLSQIAEQISWHGQKLTIDVWKRLCTAAWLREAGHSPMLVPALDGHGIDMIFEHTSKLSVAQCASLITWIEAFGSQEGVRWAAQDHYGGRY